MNFKPATKIFITYFPIILLVFQTAMNNLALINYEAYLSIGFYLSAFLGTNILYAVFSVLYTFYFKFCSISRAAAIAQLLFGIFYLIIQEDNLYNILFQLIVGTIALFWCLRIFMKKFPNCNISLVKNFFKKFLETKDCSKALELYNEEIRIELIKKEYDGS
jgi:hypothetical protein